MADMPEQILPRFFPQNARISRSGGFAEMESRIREEHASGLIEVQLNTGRRAYLLFGSGAVAGAYIVEDSSSKPISVAELTASAGWEEFPHITFHLPDMASRMAWLSLESQTQNEFKIGNAEEWGKQMRQWKAERWNGLIEIGSRDFNGFLILWRGEVLNSESIFSKTQGFTTSIPSVENLAGNPWRVVSYTISTNSLAFHCFLLRQGSEWWSHKILSHYQDMVGRKLLQILDHELNVLIEPWHWNISFANDTLMDAHFFARPTDAADAYRTLFMEMGAHMNFVIGDTLTRRILNETFAQVDPQERAALETQRLIPAAFSD